MGRGDRVLAAHEARSCWIRLRLLFGHRRGGREDRRGSASAVLCRSFCPTAGAAACGGAVVVGPDRVVGSVDEAVVIFDPSFNPDGMQRFSSWVNMHKNVTLTSDSQDREYNEAWPRSRTNHYWFDLNRDWYLAIHPESRGRLKWYHDWYPNVVADFHEMGTNATYFFEPMRPYSVKDPVMPRENYTKLNDTFAKYFQKYMDEIGSFYFTKEVFDDSYPGYGSAYGDRQGGLSLLFEQASSRGHVQELITGKITFAFTIRNQYVNSLATIEASVDNREMLLDYQQRFFNSAITEASRKSVKAYVFGDQWDKTRTRAFIDKLLIHKVKVYKLAETISRDGKTFKPDYAYIVPTRQNQYRMIRHIFETYDDYADSVYYDASAWSLVNFYNMPYAEITSSFKAGPEVSGSENIKNVGDFVKSDYAYLIPWDDYSAPAFLYYLQKGGVIATAAFKPFTISISGKNQEFSYGTIMIPVSKQKIQADSLFQLLKKGSDKYKIDVYPAATGYPIEGIALGSNYMMPLEMPNVLMLIGDGISSYEVGEIWHMMDNRIHIPITKVWIHSFDRIDFSKYNVLVMVSGSYSQLDSVKREKIKTWISKGNTLITIRQGSVWAINNEFVDEELIKKEEKDKEDDKEKPDEPVERLSYVDAPQHIGKERVSGAIFEVDLDITHPLGFGYRERKLPVYRNSSIWIAPSKNPYATVAKYTEDPHIDGYITDKNLNEFLKPSASLIVSKVGGGRVVMFAEDPNFRSSFYGTNKLFLNAVFFGQHIAVPE